MLGTVNMIALCPFISLLFGHDRINNSYDCGPKLHQNATKPYQKYQFCSDLDEANDQ